MAYSAGRLRARWLAGLLAALASVCLASVPPASAQTPAGSPTSGGALQLVSTGWGGTPVANAWNPVRLRLTGSSRDATARVEVLLKRLISTGGSSTPNGEVPLSAYAQDVALPAGSTKEVTVWVPLESDFSAEARLLAPNGRLLESVPAGMVLAVSGRQTAWPVIGVLADSATVGRTVAQIQLAVQGLALPVRSVQLAPADLPAEGARMDGLGAIVVQAGGGTAIAGLTGEQRRAVREWVMAGGHLVLSGGPDAPRSLDVLPPNTLPVTYGDVDPAANLTLLLTWAGTTDAALPPGPAIQLRAQAGLPLAGTPDRPLVWRLPLGRGSVTLLAADIALEPLAGRPQTANVLRAALDLALPRSGSADQLAALAISGASPRFSDIPPGTGSDARRLIPQLSQVPPGSFPGWGTVALLLGGFAFLAGPVTHIVLRRLDRREWMWVVVPTLSLLTCAGMYVVGAAGGRSVYANVVSHVVLDGRGGAQQALAAGFFAPTRGQLAVTVPSPSGPASTPAGEPVLHAQPTSDGLGFFALRSRPPTAEAPPVRIIAGREARVLFDGDEEGTRAVALDRGEIADAGKITALLSGEGTLIKGSVRNETPFVLEDASVALGQSVARLGTLAPGQSAPVTLDASLARAPQSGTPYGPRGTPLSGLLFGASPGSNVTGATRGALTGSARTRTQYTPSGSYELPDDPEVQRRARLLDAVVGEGAVPYWLEPSRSRALTFYAFTRQVVGGPVPTVGRQAAAHLSVVEQRLELGGSTAAFSVPAGVTPAELIAHTGRALAAGFTGQTAYWELHAGAATFRIRPTLPPNARPRSLTLTTLQLGSSQPIPTSSSSGGPATQQLRGANSTVGPAEPGTFSIYDWTRGAWEPLPGGREARLADPTPYVGPDGAVSVQVRARPDLLVRFALPELSLEGVTG
ncbi:MAG TPA: hypothetical protein VFN74_14680 [Chloroflexota bacterium]|nr:hypothetical protein [Chloroflexota bacterium]